MRFPHDPQTYGILTGLSRQTGIEDWSDLNLGNVTIDAVRSQHCGPHTQGIMALLISAANPPNA